MNANAYGGELARVLEWVDVCTAAGRRAPRARSSSGSRTGARTCAPGEVVSRASFALADGRAGGGQGDAGRDARQAPRGAAVGDQDLRLDLQEPRRPAGRGPHRRPAARGGRLLRGSRSAARGSRPSTRTSSRTPATATTADVLAVMAAGAAAGARALRGRARARGPGARRAPSGPPTGSSTATADAGEGRRRGRGGEMNPDEPIPGRDACRQAPRAPRGRPRARRSARTAKRRGAPRAARRPSAPAKRARPPARRAEAATAPRSAPPPAPQARRAAAPEPARCAGLRASSLALPPRSCGARGALAAGLPLLAARLLAGRGHRRRGRRRDHRRPRGRSSPSSPRVAEQHDDPARRLRARSSGPPRRFPTVKSVTVDPNFPHGMRIEVTERPPALLVARRRRAGSPVAADGTLLAGVAVPEDAACRCSRSARLPGGRVARAASRSSRR